MPERTLRVTALMACLLLPGAAAAECVHGAGRFSEGSVACLPTVVDGTARDTLQECRGGAWQQTGVACGAAAAEGFCTDTAEQISLRVGSTQIEVCRPTGLLRITTQITGAGEPVVLSGSGGTAVAGTNDTDISEPRIADPDEPISESAAMVDGAKVKRVKAFLAEESAGDSALNLCGDAVCSEDFNADVRAAMVKYIGLPANFDAVTDPDFRANWGGNTDRDRLFAFIATQMTDAQLVDSFVATFPVR